VGVFSIYGLFVLPPLIAYILEVYSWNFAMIVVGLICGISVFTALWLGVPNSPANAAEAAEHEAPPEDSFDFLRRSPFWIIGIVFAIIFSAAVLTTTSYTPHLQTMGYSL